MGYSYASIEETPDVKALKLLLGEASERAEAARKNPGEYARMMGEVLALVGQLAQALDANERMCERTAHEVMGQSAVGVRVH